MAGRSVVLSGAVIAAAGVESGIPLGLGRAQDAVAAGGGRRAAGVVRFRREAAAASDAGFEPVPASGVQRGSVQRNYVLRGQQLDLFPV